MTSRRLLFLALLALEVLMLSFLPNFLAALGV